MSDEEKRFTSFMPQCFINDFMSHFSGLKGTKILQDYKNLILVDSRNTAGGASNFINQTTSPSAN